MIGSTLVSSDYDSALADIGTTGAFAVTLHPDDDLSLSNDAYDFTLYKQIDGGLGTFNTSIGSWDFEGGNTNYAYYEDLSGQGLPSVLVTPTGVSGDQVNATANDAGASGGGGGKSVGADEALRVDFVDNITGVPDEVEYTDAGADAYDHNFDGHRLVNGAEVTFAVNSKTSTVEIKAYYDDDFVRGDELTENPDNVGDIDTVAGLENIIRVDINGTQITDANNNPPTGYIVDFSGDTVVVSGISDGDSVVVFTDTGFTTVEYQYVAGTPFSLEGFGASTFDPGTLVNMNFDLELTDADGDSSLVESAINVMISPDNHVIIEGTDGDDSGIDAISAGTGQASTLLGFAGDDELFGDSGNDILFGGEGNDALTGGDGEDAFFFSANASEGSDTIVDFNINEDKLSFTDLLDVEPDGDFDADDVLAFTDSVTVAVVNGGLDLELTVPDQSGVGSDTTITLSGVADDYATFSGGTLTDLIATAESINVDTYSS